MVPKLVTHAGGNQPAQIKLENSKLWNKKVHNSYNYVNYLVLE